MIDCDFAIILSLPGFLIQYVTSFLLLRLLGVLFHLCNQRLYLDLPIIFLPLLIPCSLFVYGTLPPQLRLDLVQKRFISGDTVRLAPAVLVVILSTHQQRHLVSNISLYISTFPTVCRCFRVRLGIRGALLGCWSPFYVCRALHDWNNPTRCHPGLQILVRRLWAVDRRCSLLFSPEICLQLHLNRLFSL